MHTESQAAELWCPMSRIGVIREAGGPTTVNDPTSINDFQGRCIGTRCAMWRWWDPTVRGQGSVDRKGYCGLAGKGAI